MGLGIFNRNRKSFIAPPLAPPIELRVLVDAGPAARDAFTISVSPDDSVDAIRTAVAAHIGRTGISLFKVSIPWQAQYEASAYASAYGVVPSLLTQFPGWSLDDAAPLPGAAAPAGAPYRAGSGSLRAKRRAPTVGQWFPVREEGAVHVLARTTSAAVALAPRPPLTLGARFSGRGDAAQLVIVDVDADASVRELKEALLRAAGRPAPPHALGGLTLWRVDMRAAELAAIDARGGLAGGQRPRPCASGPPLLMADCAGARVGEFFGRGASAARADPRHVALSVYVHQGAAHDLAPAVPAPPFQYPMPAGALAPRRAERALAPLPPRPSAGPSITTEAGERVAVQVALDSPSPAPSGSSEGSEGSGDTVLPHAPLRCCAGGGLVGLGIFMSPVPSSESDHTSCSEDEELPSWPPTPNVADDTYGWSSKDSWKHDFAFPASAFPSSQPASYASFASAYAGKGRAARPQLQQLFVPPSPQL